jgi:6-pyruvoyltetrahydropterin/6-carboxytetrahydropterin synthase
MTEVSRGRYRLTLAKQDFKFAAAHFTLLGGGVAEPLHGHNYRVRVEIAGDALDGDGLLVEAAPVKQAIRALCAELDDRVLVPARSPRLTVTATDDAIDVAYGARRYRFPAVEVVLLPLVNSSIELLAEHLWRRLAPALAGSHASFLAVAVEEAEGQRAVFESSLAAP